MGVQRIRVAKDKAELVKALTISEQTTGPFQTYADVMVFAAALGAKRRKRATLEKISTKEPAPISFEIFVSRGYEGVFKLLAIAQTGEAKTLSSVDVQSEQMRLRIFEEYANGGLELLQEELRGAVDYSERILLLLNAERFKHDLNEDGFDLSRFL